MRYKIALVYFTLVDTDVVKYIPDNAFEGMRHLRVIALGCIHYVPRAFYEVRSTLRRLDLQFNTMKKAQFWQK